MNCTKCGAPLVHGSAACTVCGAGLTSTIAVGGADAVTILGETHMSGPAPSPGPSRPSMPAQTGPLAPGSGFGSRYHLIRLLGMGGMGAVYQAWDEELGVSVALKVIRPEITADPDGAREIERRFKRELLLARQVTHKNVVRIHDLGEIGGIKYLTMPYIQGSDLATVLRKETRLPVPRAVDIARQVAAGLHAAHDAGVVHRDLKPANIMIDADGSAVIMDFGISRSTSGASATVAGAVIGTLEYMAPEQALAQPFDHRVDIYAFGLVIRDMLVGPRNASGAETAVAELMRRMQAPLPSIRSLDESIPDAVDAIVTKCIHPTPAERYRVTRDLVADLEALGTRSRSTVAHTAAVAPVPFTGPVPAVASRRSPVLMRAGAGALLVVVLAGGWAVWDRRVDSTAPVTAGDANVVSLALIPLTNRSGDASLNWVGPSFSDMLAAEIGTSAQLRLVPAERVFQLLRDLRVQSDSDPDPGTIRRVGEFSSASTVATGRFDKVGEQIRLSVTLHPSAAQPVILRASAAGEADLLRAATELAGLIRQNLALPSGTLRELETRTFRPSSSSVQALRHYSEGLQLARAGEHLEAARRFTQSTTSDPRFALAHARLAQSLAALGRSADAETPARHAVTLSQDLPAEERDLVAGIHARVVNDLDKAIASFERLALARPSDTQLRFELAGLYQEKGMLDKAAAEYAQVVAADGKHAEALYAAGRVAIQRGDYQGSLDALNRASTLSIQLDNQESRARVLQALGIAYKNLGKLDEALPQYEQSFAIKKLIGDKRGMAASLTEIAQIHDLQGRPDRAVARYKEALEIRRALGDKRGTGITLSNLGASYLDRGRYGEALDAFKEALQIHRETGDESWQARCLSNIGNLHYARAEYEEARTYLERALELRERSKVPGTIALTLASLGDLSTRLGEYDRAQSLYLRAIELWRGAGDRRGAALGSYGMGTLLEQQGRYGAAVDARTEALKVFREIRESSFWLAEILSGHGAGLSLVGRREEAAKSLDEALTIARQLKNDTLIAQTQNFQGSAALYRGDLAAARGAFEQAAQAAERSGNTYQKLRARVSLAQLAVQEGRAASAVGALRSLVRDAETLGLKPLAAEASFHLGAALVAARNVAEGRVELERALARSERLGARLFAARSHHLLAEVVGKAGDQQAAARHGDQARQLLAEMQKEARADILSTRQDLAALRQ